MAIYGTLKSASTPRERTYDAVAKHFSAGRGAWRPTYERLVAQVKKFGPDASVVV